MKLLVIFCVSLGCAVLQLEMLFVKAVEYRASDCLRNQRLTPDSSVDSQAVFTDLEKGSII